MKAFLIAATAANRQQDIQAYDDEIMPGQTVYAAAYYWLPTITGALWFENRQDVVDIIAGDRENYLFNRTHETDNWKIAEVTYDIKYVALDASERDAVIRKNALDRLTDDDRRVLGILT